MMDFNWDTDRLIEWIDNDEGLYDEAHRLARALWDTEEMRVEALAEALADMFIGTWTGRQFLKVYDADIADFGDMEWPKIALYYVDDIS